MAVSLWTINGETASRKYWNYGASIHFNFFHQSMKCAELLAPRNPWANPPSFPFLQLFFLFCSLLICCSTANAPSKMHVLLHCCCNCQLLPQTSTCASVMAFTLWCHSRNSPDPIVSPWLRVSCTRTSDSRLNLGRLVVLYCICFKFWSHPYEGAVCWRAPARKDYLCPSCESAPLMTL